MKATYLEDTPAAQPRFDYQLIAKALVPVLERRREGAIIVGLHGPWGSGKTTLMRELRRQLVSYSGTAGAVFIDFNAWKFQDREALWRALILHVLAELRKQGEKDDQAKAKLDELEQSLYQAFAVEEHGPWRLNWRAVIVEVIGLALQILRLDFIAGPVRDSLGWVGMLFSRKSDDDKKPDDKDGGLDPERIERLASVLERTTVERQVQKVQSIEQFLARFSALMSELSKNGQRAFVFIDDLDRCLPEAALEIFEAIKLFLDASGCAYVVAVDREVIRKGLRLRYGKNGQIADWYTLVDPDEYIEKTISLSYDLPRLSRPDAFELIKDIQLPVTLTDAHLDLIVAGIGVNPRRVKRFMNTLAVQIELARLVRGSGVPVYDWVSTPAGSKKFDLFLKFSLIGYRSSGVFAQALADPGLLERIQRVSNAYWGTVKKGQVDEARKTRADRLAGESALVYALRDDEPFWELMQADPNLLDDLTTVQLLSNWFRARPEAAPGGGPC